MNLTPLIPLSLKGEGEDFLRGASPLLNSPPKWTGKGKSIYKWGFAFLRLFFNIYFLKEEDFFGRGALSPFNSLLVGVIYEGERDKG